MEYDGLLTLTQVCATCHYPEPARSSPYPIPLSEDPPIFVWVSQMVSFPQASPPKPCIYTPLLSSPPHTLHAQLVPSLSHGQVTDRSWSVWSQSADCKVTVTPESGNGEGTVRSFLHGGPVTVGNCLVMVQSLSFHGLMPVPSPASSLPVTIYCTECGHTNGKRYDTEMILSCLVFKKTYNERII